MKDAKLTVRFPEAMKKRLDEEAAERGWNLSQLVREIIKDYFTNKDSKSN